MIFVKNIGLIILLIIQMNICFSQIRGRVVNELNEPIQFVNVTLLYDNDSTYVTGVVTDSAGYFVLENYYANNYALRLQHIGYESLLKMVDTDDIGIIKLRTINLAIDSITIVGNKKMFKVINSAIVVDVDNTVLSTVGKLSDVLQYIPFVGVSQSSIQVFGKGKPLIYINDRLERNEQIFESIDAANIKSIEVILSPGSAYDASIGSIIKIKLKQKQGDGFGGQVDALLSISEYTSEVGFVELNYRYKSLDVFGKFRMRDTRIKSNSDEDVIIESEKRWIRDAQFSKKESWFGKDGYAGFNYDLSENHSLGTKFEFMVTPALDSDSNIDEKVFENGNLLSDVNVNNRRKLYFDSYSTNVYYKGKFNKLELRVDMDFMSTSDILSQEPSENINDKVVKLYGKNKTKLYASKLVMTYNFVKAQINFGGEFTYTDYQNDFKNLTPDSSIDIPSSRTANQYSVSSGFVDFLYNTKSFEFKAGLRFEHTTSYYYLNSIIQPEQSPKSDYLFPNISVSTTLKDVFMSLSYDMKIHRPDYYMLQTDINYNSQYDYSVGNPYLIPILKHNFTWMLSHKDLNIMVGYTYNNNPIIPISTQYKDKSIILNSFRNIPGSHTIYISSNWNKKVGLWRLFAEIQLSNQYLKLNYENNNQTYSNPIVNLSLNNIFSFKRNWSLYANGYFSTGGNNSLKLYKPNGYIQLGISKSFFNDQLYCSLWSIDPFRTDSSNYDYYLNNVIINKNIYNGAKSIMFGVTYRFNTTQVRYRGSGAGNAEKGRFVSL